MPARWCKIPAAGIFTLQHCCFLFYLQGIVTTSLQPPYQIFSLGDSAVTIDYGNTISETLNEKVLNIQQWLHTHHFEGLKDIVTAYSSVTLVYDPFIVRKSNPVHGTVAEWVTALLQKAAAQAGEQFTAGERVVRIPVCYEGIYAPDLEELAVRSALTMAEVIRLHNERVYRVYMIGFLPGFSYMGEVDLRIAVARKQQAVPVMAGSVGIAGIQTGIYPLNSPGGWHIIGRTPVKMFDRMNKVPARLQAGDHVQFYAISPAAFEEEQLKNSITGNGLMS